MRGHAEFLTISKLFPLFLLFLTDGQYVFQTRTLLFVNSEVTISLLKIFILYRRQLLNKREERNYTNRKCCFQRNIYIYLYKKYYEILILAKAEPPPGKINITPAAVWQDKQAALRLRSNIPLSKLTAYRMFVSLGIPQDLTKEKQIESSHQLPYLWFYPWYHGIHCDGCQSKTGQGIQSTCVLASTYKNQKDIIDQFS